MTPQQYVSGHIARWKANPPSFVHENFGVKLDPWQLTALQAIANPELRRMAMKACKGPGKTAVLAWVILWFLACHHESKVGATSITEGNIDTNLWPELAHWRKRSAFLSDAFFWTRTLVGRKDSAEWFAVKRTWPKTGNPQAQADALAGIHADDVMFVLDESGGIPLAVMVTAEAVLATLTAGHRAIVVQAGNPTHTTGPLYRACTIDKHLWFVITITGDPDDPQRSSRIDVVWAREQIEQYGRDNPWVMVNVLGQFPPSSINALLGVEEVEAAMKRMLRKDEYDWAQKRLGVDVARFGDDKTVIFPRQGLAAFRPIVMRGARTTEIASRIFMAKQRWKSELEIVDDTGGWGHGVVDNLITLGVNPIPLNYAAKALSKKFKSRRCEIWWNGTQAIRNGAGLPNIPEMVGELSEPTYTYVGGQILVEPKDMVKERIGRSPDYADAYNQTYALPDMPGEMQAKLHRGDKAGHDFDPYGVGRSNERDRDREPMSENDWNPYM